MLVWLVGSRWSACLACSCCCVHTEGKGEGEGRADKLPSESASIHPSTQVACRLSAFCVCGAVRTSTHSGVHALMPVAMAVCRGTIPIGRLLANCLLQPAIHPSIEPYAHSLLTDGAPYIIGRDSSTIYVCADVMCVHVCVL